MNSFLCFLVLFNILITVHSHHSSCLAPNAIFGFSDSISDTGNLVIADPDVPAANAPYGMTINNATGRWSNGYLIIDYLNLAFTNQLETPSFARNPSDTTYTSLGFGSAGSTVLQPQYDNMNPDIFPSQIKYFLDYQKQLYDANAATPKRFSDALYYIETGGNDINFAITVGGRTFDDIIENLIPQVVQGLRDGIATLHTNGSAVHFLVFGMPAGGCSPLFLARPGHNVHLDKFGCDADVNHVIFKFNAELNKALGQLIHEYPEANIMYFDFFSGNIKILMDGQKSGVSSTNLYAACCGGGGDFNCAYTPTGCGCNSTATVCSNPNDHISWDGVHYTQHFYNTISDMILTGMYLSPPIKFCTV